MGDMICVDADCSPCCLIFDCCGACCEGCNGCGDDCCSCLGDSLGCCDSTMPAFVGTTTDFAGASIPAMVGRPSLVDVQPAGSTMLPTLDLTWPARYDDDVGSRRNNYPYSSHGHRPYGRQDHSCPSLRTVLIWLFAVAIIAAIGVTYWLTRSIPFGTNCGNAHRALLGALTVIVVGGICMPLYYHYIQQDMDRKEIDRQLQALTNTATFALDPSALNRNRKRKKSVLASERFSLALKGTTLVLIVLVALGYYYLWGKENQCMDSALWIVKGWFIALLFVAVVVTAFMLSAMYHAVKERHELNTTRYTADEEQAWVNRAINMDSIAQPSALAMTVAPLESSLSTASPHLPPAYPSSPTTTPPTTPNKSATGLSKSQERVQTETMLAEQQQQEQQRQQQQRQMDQTQFGYGASGTGAYC